MLRQTGVATISDIASVLPTDERLHKGPVAIIECFQRIPCDPCHSSCPTHAVLPFLDINDLPHIDNEKCNGCGSCVAACPGLACFVVHYDYSPDRALVKIPYELRPLPDKQQEVKVMDRSGSTIGTGEVVRVQVARARTATPVVWVSVPKSMALDARHIAF